MKLMIQNVEYDIQFITNNELRIVVDDEDSAPYDYYGYHDGMMETIYINSEVSKRTQLMTIIHEALHAIFCQLGEDGHNNDEKLICAVSNTLLGLFLDNPQLMDKLNELNVTEKSLKHNS